jgi:hypothetical protein
MALMFLSALFDAFTSTGMALGPTCPRALAASFLTVAFLLFSAVASAGIALAPMLPRAAATGWRFFLFCSRARACTRAGMALAPIRARASEATATRSSSRPRRTLARVGMAGAARGPSRPSALAALIRANGPRSTSFSTATASSISGPAWPRPAAEDGEQARSRRKQTVLFIPNPA